jgi:hypothetical protein
VTDTPRVQWPGGKRFAFSVIDDTDRATLDNVPAVYRLLAELGMRTTKTVWPLAGDDHAGRDGRSCADPAYVRWVRGLRDDGFEIALHNAASRTSPRERTIAGLDRFAELFGGDPSIHANHSACRENIYWGDRRVSGVNALAYNVLNRFRTRGAFEGHDERSPLFWGDACRARIRYVRNFVHGDVDTLAFCPEMPYHDPDRPYVAAWFAATEGPDVDAFAAALTEPRLDRLERRGGACIMYTHFASGFVRDGRVDPRVVGVLRRLSSRDGWFVPVSELLDHLVAVKGRHVLTAAERARLERRWLVHKLRVGGRS